MRALNLPPKLSDSEARSYLIRLVSDVNKALGSAAESCRKIAELSSEANGEDRVLAAAILTRVCRYSDEVDTAVNMLFESMSRVEQRIWYTEQNKGDENETV